MGLDIYFYKVKPNEGTNTNSVAELRRDRLEQGRAKFEKNIKTLLDEFEHSVSIGNRVRRTNAIAAIANYVKEINGGYNFYAEPFLKEGITDDKVRELVEYNTKHYYPQEDVYFRKANFVYRFFHPHLVDEECVVTQEMVTELLNRCDKVIEAVKKDGVINEEGEIDKKYYACEDFYNLTEAAQKLEIDRVDMEIANMPRNWVAVAADLLPTQSGFFFGTTDYSTWYLEDILSCKEQFTKLLKDWKPDEVVYNVMSW